MLLHVAGCDAAATISIARTVGGGAAAQTAEDEEKVAASGDDAPASCAADIGRRTVSTICTKPAGVSANGGGAEETRRQCPAGDGKKGAGSGWGSLRIATEKKKKSSKRLRRARKEDG